MIRVTILCSQIRNVRSWNEEGYEGCSRAFEVDAFPERPMENVVLEHVDIKAKEFGRIAGIKNWQWKDVNISVEEETRMRIMCMM